MSSMNYWGPGGTPQPTGLLTRQQLAAKQPQTKYQDYVNYVTRTRARRAATRQNAWNSALGPLAAVVPPPGYFQQQAQSLYPILSPQEIQRRTETSISSQINPILENLRATSARATTAGTQQIQSYAQGAQASLAQIAPQVQQAYEEALGQQQKIDAGLSGLMGKAGKNAAGSVGQALGAAHQVAGGAVGSISGMGAGAAATEAGYGSASQSELVADQAAQTAYAAGLPGVASSQGQFDMGRFALNQQRSLEDQIGSITSQIPGITQSLLQSYQDDNLESRKGRAALISGGWQSALTAAGTNLGLKMDQARIDEALKEAGIRARTDITTQGMSEAGQNARNTQSVNAAAAANTADNAAAMDRLKYQAAHQGLSAGSNPLSPSNLRSTTKDLVAAARAARNRTVPQAPFNAAGDPQPAKRADPQPNNQVYQMIYNRLYNSFGAVQKDPNWYINQIVGIAQSAGYARATRETVLAAALGKPTAAAKTAAGGAPPAGPKTAAGPTRTPQGAPPVVRGPKQDPAAVRAQGDKVRFTAYNFLTPLRNKGVSKQEAFNKLVNFLTPAYVNPTTASAVARREVDEMWAKPGAIARGNKDTGAPPNASQVSTVGKTHDGKDVVTLKDRSVWRVDRSTGKWTKLWAPPKKK